MGVRANWFVDDLQVATDDPFAREPEIAGQPIELAGESARLSRRLVELAHGEQTLYNAGVTCEIKDRADTACSACPARSHDQSTSLSSLCAIGVEQEQLCTRIAIEQIRGA